MVGAVVVYSILGLSIVLMVIERHIRKKPEGERTDRQKRFMAADLAAGRNIQAPYTDPRLIHGTGVGLGALLVVLGVIWLVTGQLAAGVIGLIGGAVGLLYGLIYFVSDVPRKRDQPQDDDPTSR